MFPYVSTDAGVPEAHDPEQKLLNSSDGVFSRATNAVQFALSTHVLDVLPDEVPFVHRREAQVWTTVNETEMLAAPTSNWPSYEHEKLCPALAPDAYAHAVLAAAVSACSSETEYDPSPAVAYTRRYRTGLLEIDGIVRDVNPWPLTGGAVASGAHEAPSADPSIWYVSS